MEISEDHCDSAYIIRAYEPGQITINEDHYDSSLIVNANRLISDWPPHTTDDLEQSHWQPLLELKPELVIIGSGTQFKLLPAALLAPLYEHKISVECMDTGAACRTFMALVSEGRNVAAALLIK